VGPNPIVAEAFLFVDPPQELEGAVTYTSWGIPCFALQAAGLPCNGMIDLDGLRLDSGELSGTITTSNRTVLLTLQIDEEMLIEDLVSFRASGTVQGQVFVPEQTPGDINGDGVVDLADFAEWPGCVTGPGNGPYGAGCGLFDFTGDMDVDLYDFAMFQEHFTGPGAG
jgi:hypothetical protein